MDKTPDIHAHLSVPELWHLIPFLDWCGPFSVEWLLDRLEAGDARWD